MARALTIGTSGSTFIFFPFRLLWFIELLSTSIVIGKNRLLSQVRYGLLKETLKQP